MAQPDYSDGSMLALYPPPALAKKLAIPGGLDPGDLHLTVAYTGDAADVDRKDLRKAAKNTAAAVSPVTATISGHARLPQDDHDVIVALVDSPQLDKLRAAAVDQLASQGITAAANHGYLAHITLAYVGHDDPDPVGRLTPIPATFSELTASHGKNRKAHPFDDTLTEAAREAYAAGWALSGGPLTERVAAGAQAAIHTALAHADDPHVLEATLQIGKLEGTWARYFARRQALVDQHVPRVLAAWQPISADLHPRPVVARLRAELGTAKPQPDQADYLRSITGTAAASLLAGAYAHVRHNDLQATIQDALRAAMAEGQAGALALHAEKHGHIAETTTTATGQSYNWDAAYEAIYDQLINLPELPLMAQEWVQRILAGTARDVGGVIARLFEQQASVTEMATAVAAAVSTAEGTAASRAVTAFVNQAMAQAMSKASLALYQSEGTEQVYFVTAGDAAVCPTCQGYEDGNPYDTSDVPTPAIHPFCRCVLTPDDPTPFKALAAYLA